jgi:sec-independent protein translocase protein TatC
VTRLGIVTPEQLAKNRRYAYLVLAVLAMLLPGTDPISMLIELVPLVLLYEASVLFARAFGRPPEEAPDREIAVSEAPPSGPA